MAGDLIRNYEDDLLNSPEFAAMREMLKRTAGMGGPDEEDPAGASVGFGANIPGVSDTMTDGGAMTPDARSAGLASLAALRKQGDETYQQLTRDLKATYERSAEVLRQRRFGPTRAEQLFAVSAALAQPTRYKGIAASFGNLAPVLSQIAEAKRTGQYEQAKQLSDLAQQNLTKAQNLELDRMKTATDLAGLEAKYATSGAGRVWDSQRGRWITKGAVEAVDVGTDEQGRKVVRYTDGTFVRTEKDGSQVRFDAEGNPING